MRARCLILLSVLTLGGCFVSHRTLKKGTPLAQHALNRIVIGTTTRSEVFELLGPPHSILTGQAEFMDADYLGYYSHTLNRQLGSIDDTHYVLLYRYGETQDSFSAALLLGEREHFRAQLLYDELLIMIDSKTNLVTDIAYHKEPSQE